MKTPQQRAAETRRRNDAGQRMYEEITKPAHDKVEKVLNFLLLGSNVRVRMVGPSARRLLRSNPGSTKHRAQIDQHILWGNVVNGRVDRFDNLRVLQSCRYQLRAEPLSVVVPVLVCEDANVSKGVVPFSLLGVKEGEELRVLGIGGRNGGSDVHWINV